MRLRASVTYVTDSPTTNGETTKAMRSPRNTSIRAVRTIHAALDLLDQRKNALCALAESEQVTSEEKYEALVALAYMTGVLSNVAGEA